MAAFIFHTSIKDISNKKHAIFFRNLREFLDEEERFHALPENQLVCRLFAHENGNHIWIASIFLKERELARCVHEEESDAIQIQSQVNDSQKKGAIIHLSVIRNFLDPLINEEITTMKKNRASKKKLIVAAGALRAKHNRSRS